MYKGWIGEELDIEFALGLDLRQRGLAPRLGIGVTLGFRSGLPLRGVPKTCKRACSARPFLKEQTFRELGQGPQTMRKGP